MPTSNPKNPAKTLAFDPSFMGSSPCVPPQPQKWKFCADGRGSLQERGPVMLNSSPRGPPPGGKNWGWICPFCQFWGPHPQNLWDQYSHCPLVVSAPVGFWSCFPVAGGKKRPSPILIHWNMSFRGVFFSRCSHACSGDTGATPNSIPPIV